MSDISLRAVPPADQSRPVAGAHARLLVFTWVATLLVSSLPAILWQELHIQPAMPMLPVRIVLLVAFMGVTFLWKAARPLRAYFFLFLCLYLADAFFTWIGTTAVWQGWFKGAESSFNLSMMSGQLLRLATAVVMVAVLWLVFKRREDFFLTRGEINATAEPVRWIGMARPTGWKRFGLILSLCIALGVLAFVFIFSHPALDSLGQVIPFLPIVFLAAAMNAFSEEMAFRASLLAPLLNVVGKSQALLMTAALFGLWHFYGVPYGVLGVVMAGFLGWLLGKSMLETRGLFWAWFIHFWQDVVIFIFIAIGSVTSGG
ncbi:MAG: CPBP family intramembrane glutamic endopeptidase [Anaerolineae bacterium]